MRQGEGRDVQAAYAADVYADVKNALSAQQSFRASQAPPLRPPTPAAAPRPSSARYAESGFGGMSSSVRCPLPLILLQKYLHEKILE